MKDDAEISRRQLLVRAGTFRHSASSFVNAQTGNLKLAQKLLGHSNLSTTADIYTRLHVRIVVYDRPFYSLVPLDQ
jgi:site-specific recombinase XerC